MATRPDTRLRLRAMVQEDVAAVHALSKSEQWPHRPEDIADMLAVGDGIVAETDGEVVGCTMWWPGGADVATLGMALVAAGHRGTGVGRRVVEAAIERIGDKAVVLNATEQGLPLYRKLGFEPIGEIQQQQGTSFSAPLVALDPGERIRPLGARDADAVSGMLTAATGLSRPAMMALLLDRAHGIVLDVDGTLTGCALFRRFGRGYAIGPVVAPDRHRAQALIAQWLGSRSGEFIRLDVTGDPVLSDWLEELGLVRVGRVVTMVRGTPPAPAAPGRSFAIVSQALC